MTQVDISESFEFFRGLFIQIWGIFTNKFLVYGNMSFSIFDLFIGFVFLGIILRLVYARMHLASAVNSYSRSQKRGRAGDDDNGQSWYESHTYPIEK